MTGGRTKAAMALDSVSVIDAKDLRVVAASPVGRGPNGISITP